MPTVRVKENEPFEVAMRRFKRTVEKTGLLTELRAREYYEKPTAERKRKLAAAVKRHAGIVAGSLDAEDQHRVILLQCSPFSDRRSKCRLYV